MENLYEAVRSRPRPEDVAELVIAAIGATFSQEEARIASEAAAYSFRRLGYTWSSMSNDFAPPSSATKQTDTAARLFDIPRLTPEARYDPTAVDLFISDAVKLRRLGRRYKAR
jgi:hypothetical protein